VEIQKKQREGKPLDDFEKEFLETFLESNEYRNIGSLLEKQLQAEGAA